MITKIYGLNTSDNTVRTFSIPAFRGKLQSGVDTFEHCIKQVQKPAKQPGHIVSECIGTFKRAVDEFTSPPKIQTKIPYTVSEQPWGKGRKRTISSADKTFTSFYNNSGKLIERRSEQNGFTERHIYNGDRPVIIITKTTDGTEKLVLYRDIRNGTTYIGDENLVILSDETKKHLRDHFSRNMVFDTKGNINGGHSADYYENIANDVKKSKDGKLTINAVIKQKDKTLQAVKADVTVKEYKDACGRSKKEINFKLADNGEDLATLRGPFEDKHSGTQYYEVIKRNDTGIQPRIKSVVPQEAFDAIDLDHIPQDGISIHTPVKGQEIYYFKTKYNGEDYYWKLPLCGCTLHPVSAADIKNEAARTHFKLPKIEN